MQPQPAPSYACVDAEVLPQADILQTHYNNNGIKKKKKKEIPDLYHICIF